MTKQNLKIPVFAGDAIGPEIIRDALKVLKLVAARRGISLSLASGLIGGSAYDACGTPFPGESLHLALQSDAVLLGAVGGPKWEGLDYSLRPERALLGLREKLGLYANLRPVTVFDELADASPLKKDLVQGIDLLILRELTGDIYFGKPRGVTKDQSGRRTGVNTMIYTEDEIRRIAIRAFVLARGRRKKLLSVDKANVLETTELWRQVVTETGGDYPDVSLSHMYVDNCAMQLVRNPSQFDVIVTANLFGDILSDEAAMLTGSIGMLPSASLGDGKALYEPIHGSAPDIAGQDKANPLATILSLAMMFRYTFGNPEVAGRIEGAVRRVLAQGHRTGDIALPGEKVVGTRAMGDAVVAAL